MLRRRRPSRDDGRRRCGGCLGPSLRRRARRRGRSWRWAPREPGGRACGKDGCACSCALCRRMRGTSRGRRRPGARWRRRRWVARSSSRRGLSRRPPWAWPRRGRRPGRSRSRRRRRSSRRRSTRRTPRPPCRSGPRRRTRTATARSRSSPTRRGSGPPCYSGRPPPRRARCSPSDNCRNIATRTAGCSPWPAAGPATAASSISL
mmetsp:Transcript_20315/g.65451  ORF Transcript_20315/g.65451 Transcript_20315/m.65451 type:complete len:205 (+) Transcript_20315:326-940(+)